MRKKNKCEREEYLPTQLHGSMIKPGVQNTRRSLLALALSLGRGLLGFGLSFGLAFALTHLFSLLIRCRLLVQTTSCGRACKTRLCRRAWLFAHEDPVTGDFLNMNIA